MQQTLTGCAFCDAPPGAEAGEAHTWGQDERVTHQICVDYAIQTESDPDKNACGLGADSDGRRVRIPRRFCVRPVLGSLDTRPRPTS
jgi:hypothetical protein